MGELLLKTKHIYLVFSKTGTWLSRLIGFVIKTPYTHVALTFDDKFDTLYTFGRVNPDNPFSGGFTIESLNAGVYKKSSSTYCGIYKMQITSKQLNKLKEELDKFIHSNINYKYNFLGLITLLFGKPLERKTHYFCSQFLTILLDKSDIWHSPKHSGLTRPTDLLLIEDKELVFKGPVQNVNSAKKDITA